MGSGAKVGSGTLLDFMVEACSWLKLVLEHITLHKQQNKRIWMSQHILQNLHHSARQSCVHKDASKQNNAYVFFTHTQMCAQNILH